MVMPTCTIVLSHKPWDRLGYLQHGTPRTFYNYVPSFAFMNRTGMRYHLDQIRNHEDPIEYVEQIRNDENLVDSAYSSPYLFDNYTKQYYWKTLIGQGC
jgi:hypothetical protein